MRNNRGLLRREIGLLTPELVVLVGGEAKRIIGREALEAEPHRYCAVNFPNNGRDETRKAADEKGFKELRRRLENWSLKSKTRNGDVQVR